MFGFAFPFRERKCVRTECRSRQGPWVGSRRTPTCGGSLCAIVETFKFHAPNTPYTPEYLLPNPRVGTLGRCHLGIPPRFHLGGIPGNCSWCAVLGLEFRDIGPVAGGVPLAVDRCVLSSKPSTPTRPTRPTPRNICSYTPELAHVFVYTNAHVYVHTNTCYLHVRIYVHTLGR